MSEEKKKIIIEAEDTQPEEEKVKKDTIRVLSFSLGGENYCADIKEAKEAVKLTHVTRVPGAPEFIMGVMNLRGEIIALCDIRHFLGLEQKEKTRYTRVIITDTTGSPMGILVDKVESAIDIDEKSIQPPLATLNEKLAQYTKGQAQIDSNILIFLDLKKLLTCEEMERLKKGGL